MSSTQRTIKYLAIAFAVFLIVTIFGAILSVGTLVIKSIHGLSKPTSSSLNHEMYSTYVDINLNASNLVIKNGEALKVENNNDKIKVTLEGNKLLITDESGIFNRNKDEELIVYVPEYIKYDIISISTGAGRINVDGFKTKELKLNLGAGDARFSNIYSDKSDISTGAGRVKFDNSVLNDAKLDLGVGEININANITGDSKINCGIGSVELNLPGSKEDYTFDVSKGIGNITFNHYGEVGDKSKLGNGQNFIKIDGGIGKISVTTN